MKKLDVFKLLNIVLNSNFVQFAFKIQFYELRILIFVHFGLYSNSSTLNMISNIKQAVDSVGSFYNIYSYITLASFPLFDYKSNDAS
jgi:hypothetical protein